MKRDALSLAALIAALGGVFVYDRFPAGRPVTLPSVVSPAARPVELPSVVSPAVRHIKLPSVVPVGGDERVIAAMSEGFPGRTAQVVVAARLPFAAIRQQAEQAVPPGLHRPYTVADTNGFSNIRVNPDISRDPLSLQPEVNSTPPKMLLASRIHGTVEVKAEKRVAMAFLLTGNDDRIPVTQPGIRVDASIHGWISAGIDAKWMFTHQEDIDVDVTRAEFKLFGVVPVSIKEEVQNRLNSAAPKMIKNTFDAMCDKLPIRSDMEKVWRRLFKPIKVGSHPDAYILLTPERARLQQVAFEDPNYLTVRVALDGNIQTLVGVTAPPEAAPTPIPDLLLESGVDSKFHALVPVGFELSAVNQTLKGQLGDQRIPLAADESVVVKGCEFSSKAGVLYVKMDIDAESKSSATTLDGTIFLKCGLAYDELAHELRLEGVDFSAETRSTLANVASWLLKDVICRRIEESFKLDVAGDLQKRQSEVIERYAALIVAPEGLMNPHLDTVKFEGVRLGDGFVVVGFDLSGEIPCDINISPPNG